MFMLAERKPAESNEHRRFWIDTAAEVALNVHVYEQKAEKPSGDGEPSGSKQALMDCYNGDC